jgi:ABC-type proline/glycine betaine transport system ATPase subunit
MSDRVLIMKDGNFIQNGKPEDVISISSTASQKNLI